AQGSNIGRYSTNSFAILPEEGIKLGYQVTPHTRLTLGYSFLYLTDVARPGNQIDTGVNRAQLPSFTVVNGQVVAIPNSGQGIGPARPGFLFQHSDFWAQGVSFGIEFRY